MALYLAWRHPRVRTLIQYQWRDELVRNAGRGFARYAGWQSGLRFFDDRPKPAERAFVRPLVAVRVGSSVMFWGRATAGRGSREVELQMRARRDPDHWTRVLRVRSSATGVWRKWLPSVSPGKYRFVATDAAKHASPRTSHILSLEPNHARRTIIVPAG